VPLRGVQRATRSFAGRPQGGEGVHEQRSAGQDSAQGRTVHCDLGAKVARPRPPCRHGRCAPRSDSHEHQAAGDSFRASAADVRCPDSDKGLCGGSHPVVCIYAGTSANVRRFPERHCCSVRYLPVVVMPVMPSAGPHAVPRPKAELRRDEAVGGSRPDRGSHRERSAGLPDTKATDQLLYHVESSHTAKATARTRRPARPPRRCPAAGRPTPPVGATLPVSQVGDLGALHRSGTTQGEVDCVAR
jgi:hypothetical protein